MPQASRVITSDDVFNYMLNLRTLNEGIDEKRDYRAMYRAAFEYHDRHNPPRIDREYWQTHEPGVDDVPQAELDYWDKAAQDICEVSNRFGNDKFIVDLLAAIYDELGREYADARRQAAEQPFNG